MGRQEQKPSAVEEGGIDVAPLLRALWVGRWAIIAITSICTILGIAYALRATEWYQADVVLIQTDGAGASATLGQLGSLASLAGISLGGAGGERAPMAVLRSKSIIKEFIEKRGLVPVLFAEKWDSEAGAWRTPDGAPDIRDAVARFDRKVRSVSEDKNAGVVVLSVTWTDANLAADWANALIDLVNDELRVKAIDEAERNISYLREQMVAHPITALQQSIARVLESEMQKMMMANGSDEYGFKVIDRAFPPKIRARPQRTLIAVSSLAFGFFLSCMFVLIWRGTVGTSNRYALSSNEKKALGRE